jgi:hypothetical protein
VRGASSLKDHNKNFAFKKAVEELTFPCIDKEYLTLAELVKVIPYIANTEVNIYSDVFNGDADVTPNGFFILVGKDNEVKQIASIYYSTGSGYKRHDPSNQEQIIDNLYFPLTDKDIMLIEKSLAFSGNDGVDYTADTVFKNTQYSGTIYVYSLN